MVYKSSLFQALLHMGLYKELLGVCTLFSEKKINEVLVVVIILYLDICTRKPDVQP